MHAPESTRGMIQKNAKELTRMKRILSLILMLMLLIPTAMADSNDEEYLRRQRIGNACFEHGRTWLENRGYLPLLDETAYIFQNDHVITPLVEVLEAGEAYWNGEGSEKYLFHRDTTCDPAAEELCTYFGIHFCMAEKVLLPCPDCFPEGIHYTISVSESESGPILLKIGAERAHEGKLNWIVMQYDEVTFDLLTVSAYGNQLVKLGLIDSYDPQMTYVSIHRADDAAKAETVFACANCSRHPEMPEVTDAWYYCTKCANLWNPAIVKDDQEMW